MRRMQFGRRSEKLDRQIKQLELRLEELEADEGAVPIVRISANVTADFGNVTDSAGLGVAQCRL
ncbi:hypothetical protein LA345_28955 [Burkholderia vietnamiensis]|nr:hypothetical protein [Burkholderia vietnamiensis]